MRCCCIVLAVLVALTGALVAIVTPSVVQFVQERDTVVSYRTQIFSITHKALFTLSGASTDSFIPFHRTLLDLFSFRAQANPFQAPDGVLSIDLEIPSLDSSNSTVSIRLYTPPTARSKEPTDEKKPVYVWAHGGGFVSGSAKERGNDRVARTICLLSEFYVIAVDYRLAPEYPFPAAVEDFHSVLHWLNEAEHLLIKGGPLDIAEILRESSRERGEGDSAHALRAGRRSAGEIESERERESERGRESERESEEDEGFSYYAAAMDLKRVVVAGEEAGANLALMGSFLWKERGCASAKDVPVERRVAARPIVHHHFRGTLGKDEIKIAAAALLYPSFFYGPLRLEPLFENQFCFVNRGMVDFFGRAYLLGSDMENDEQFRELVTNNPFVSPFAESSQDIIEEWLLSTLLAQAELEPLGVETNQFYNLITSTSKYCRIGRYRGGTHRFLYYDDRRGQPVVQLYEFVRSTSLMLLGLA